MKQTILISIATAFFTAALCWVLFYEVASHRVTWQYDPWRKAYAAEQERQALQARLAAEFARTNKPVPVTNTVLFGNTYCVTNGSFVTWTYSSWQSVNPPHFEEGTIELGYRADGVVTYRIPPELRKTNTLEKLVASVKGLVK